MPLSMGKVIWTDPRTFDQDIDHPYLSVGGSSCSLKPEIRSWMKETFGKCVFEFDGTDYCLYFDNEEALTWFRLKWP